MSLVEDTWGPSTVTQTSSGIDVQWNTAQEPTHESTWPGTNENNARKVNNRSRDTDKEPSRKGNNRSQGTNKEHDQEPAWQREVIDWSTPAPNETNTRKASRNTGNFDNDPYRDNESTWNARPKKGDFYSSNEFNPQNYESYQNYESHQNYGSQQNYESQSYYPRKAPSQNRGNGKKRFPPRQPKFRSPSPPSMQGGRFVPMPQPERANSNRRKDEFRGGNNRSRDSRRQDGQNVPPKSLALPELMDLEKPERVGFRGVPIIPTQEELMAERPTNLPYNKLDEPYDSVDDYLEAHFRLLREDCLRPLREGIKNIREGSQREDIPDDYGYTNENNTRGGYTNEYNTRSDYTNEYNTRGGYPNEYNMRDDYANNSAHDGYSNNTNTREGDTNETPDKREDHINHDIRLYEHVQIVGVTFANVGVVHRISFRLPYGEKITWLQSKRLIPGTLVVFSNDNFANITVGVVVNRPVVHLKSPSNLQIDVMLYSSDFKISLPEDCIMAESTAAYFEAYRHILLVLQELDPETLPFKNNIVRMDDKIEPPEYLDRRLPSYNFEGVKDIIDLETTLGTSRVNVLDEWPEYNELRTTLHSSQYEALQCMLTKSLAVIQGPPGTGKTFVGLAAARLLLENMSGIIVIACQTNHALDQFLEGIQIFEQNIIRLGSRSQSLKIKPKTLYKIREIYRGESRVQNNELKKLFKERDKIEGRMQELVQEVQKPCIDLDYIKKKKFFTPKQIESLVQDDWVTSKNHDGKSHRNFIREWLEQAIATHSSKHDALDHHISQLDTEGKIVPEDDDDTDIDEEDLEMITTEFQDVPTMEEGQILHGQFDLLRSDEFVDSDNSLVTPEVMTKFKKCNDVWKIPSYVRAAIHNRWRDTRLEEIKTELKKLDQKYLELSVKIKREQLRVDISILKTAKIVGMTTTAAAKNHELLINLQPKIIMIEEAAETLEAHIITALTPATQHLILIGDHQQLRPSTAVHALAADHRLDVSLFERLTGFTERVTLTEQRRMRPDIRELLSPIYLNSLSDNPLVTKYPNVKGICNNLYFLTHEEEEENAKGSRSKINEHEAQMCAKLASYLIKGTAYSAKQITILTMYTGQRKRIQRLLTEESRKSLDNIKQIRVSSVDGFQGEENDIIILSLVRSSPQKGIGFLSVSNRVCVALSRAKHGLFIFGNAGQLKEKSELWKDVIEILEGKGQVGDELKLYCHKHSRPKEPVITEVTWPVDFPPSGGCASKCGEMMECGHMCPRDCHLSPHDKIECWEPCMRTLSCGHPCKKDCRFPCGSCNFTILVRPRCGHNKEIVCHQTAEQYVCSEKCSKKLDCGHQCEEKCSSPRCTIQCRQTVTVKFPHCKHTGRSFCFEAKEKIRQGCPFC